MKALLNEDLVKSMFENVHKQYNEMYLMNAIWLEPHLPLNVVRGGKKAKTIRMALTDNVKVVDGNILDALDGNDATHEIVRIKGTNRTDNNIFEIEARNLLTDQIETIKLL